MSEGLRGTADTPSCVTLDSSCTRVWGARCKHWYTTSLICSMKALYVLQQWGSLHGISSFDGHSRVQLGVCVPLSACDTLCGLHIVRKEYISVCSDTLDRLHQPPHREAVQELLQLRLQAAKGGDGALAGLG